MKIRFHRSHWFAFTTPELLVSILVVGVLAATILILMIETSIRDDTYLAANAATPDLIRPSQLSCLRSNYAGRIYPARVGRSDFGLTGFHASEPTNDYAAVPTPLRCVEFGINEPKEDVRAGRVDWNGHPVR